MSDWLNKGYQNACDIPWAGPRPILGNFIDSYVAGYICQRAAVGLAMNDKQKYNIDVWYNIHYTSQVTILDIKNSCDVEDIQRLNDKILVLIKDNNRIQNINNVSIKYKYCNQMCRILNELKNYIINKVSLYLVTSGCGLDRTLFIEDPLRANNKQIEILISNNYSFKLILECSEFDLNNLQSKADTIEPIPK
eukprot:15145_1